MREFGVSEEFGHEVGELQFALGLVVLHDLLRDGRDDVAHVLELQVLLEPEEVVVPPLHRGNNVLLAVVQFHAVEQV